MSYTRERDYGYIYFILLSLSPRINEKKNFFTCEMQKKKSIFVKLISTVLNISYFSIFKVHENGHSNEVSSSKLIWGKNNSYYRLVRIIQQ